jgi:hypothetical protein
VLSRLNLEASRHQDVAGVQAVVELERRDTGLARP